MDWVETEYGYDDIDQLVSEVRSGYSASYTYDANGNRLTRTVNSVTEDYVYDDADKLLEVKIGQQTVKEFTYDSAGRTTAVETSAGTTSLTYDYESRVTGITYPSQATNSFAYNGLDTRVGMSDSGGSKTFLRDGVSVTSPVLSDGSADYTPAISERRSSTSTFYHGGIKNGDSQSSTSESVTGSIQYDAFGNVTSSSGTWQGPFAYGGPYGYQTDPDSGLKLLGHRYYDPSTGRFLTRDPVRDGRNWYGYCGNNPLIWADPEGLSRGGRILKFLGKNDWIKYIIDPSKNQQKKRLKTLPGEVVPHPGHKGGPDHVHVGDSKIHYTTEAEADEASGFPWDNWRNHSRLLLIIIALLTRSPIEAAMEGGKWLGDAIDPYVSDAAKGYRYVRIDRWLGDD